MGGERAIAAALLRAGATVRGGAAEGPALDAEAGQAVAVFRGAEGAEFGEDGGCGRGPGGIGSAFLRCGGFGAGAGRHVARVSDGVAFDGERGSGVWCACEGVRRTPLP